VQKFSGTRLVRVRSEYTRRYARFPRGPRLEDRFMEASNYGTGQMNLRGFTHTLAGCDDALGFSLKPPKFIRKAATAIKKNVTLKRALVGGAIVGAAFIPGVAPAALAIAKGAGRGAARAARGIASLFKPKVAPGSTPPTGPQETPEDQKARQDALDAQARADAAAIIAAYKATQGGGAPPDNSTPNYSPPAAGPSAGGSSGGGSSGGGGSAPGPGPADAPLPDDTETDASMVKPNGEAGFSPASALPILLGIGALVLLNRPRGKRRAA
jgi:hypothetical protein